MAATWLVATGLLLLVFLTGKKCNEVPGRFAIPFDVKLDGSTVYGDTRISDANGFKVEEVTLSNQFKFGKENFTIFYIHFNCGIRTRKSSSIHIEIKFWAENNENIYEIFPFLQDVGSCESKKNCGVYFRHGNNIDQATKTSVSELVNRFKRNNMKYNQNVEDFKPDSSRTMVVTWYNVPVYTESNKPKSNKTNSFQGVITSDGTSSYAIISFKSIKYPTKADTANLFKVGVQFSQNNFCSIPIEPSGNNNKGLPVNPTQLFCQSNVFQRGTYVFDLQEETACDSNKQYLKSTCADCQDSKINNVANIFKNCPSSKELVCGQDGKTYNNLCSLRQTACSNFSVANHKNIFHHFGKCYETLCNNGNNGCEEKCMDNNKVVSCKCSDGKKLKNDGKSCDWSGYMYMANANGLNISKHDVSKSIATSKVDAMAHDFQTNTIFYATEVFKNGKREFQIKWSQMSNMTVNVFPADGQVTHMMFSSSESSIYYALRNGQVKKISNIYISPQVSNVYKFSGVIGMVGESCGRNGFVLDPNGEIFHLNNNKVIVKDIKNASGLAIDTEKHKLYWSSASGIYESNYDGSCLRNVSSAVRNRRNLYFHDDLLHFLHENSMDQSSLMKMDVKNGEESIVKKFNYHVSGFGIFSNDERWTKTSIMNKRIAKLNKEFKIKIRFSATAPKKEVRSLKSNSFNIVSIQKIENSMIEIHFANSAINMTFNISSGKNEVEVGQMKKGQEYFFYVRINERHMMTAVNNSNERDFKNVQMNGFTKDFDIYNKDIYPFCKVKMTCPSQCGLDNGGCEDQCMSTKNGAVCKCTGDKVLKSDGKSCHWKEYFLLGSENNLYLANNFVTHTIPVMGNVTATSTDYSTNTLFYATVSMNNGREEFSINSFQPKQNYKVLLSNLTARVTAMVYSSKDMYLYYACSDGYLYKLSNIYGEQVNHSRVMDHHFGTITDIEGESCTGKMFVLDSENGTIWAFNESTNFPTIPKVFDGLKNLKALTIDHVNRMLFWYSDAGIEESRLDGGCRRLVANKSSLHGEPIKMVFSDALYWTNSKMIGGKYYLMKTNIQTGVTTYMPSSNHSSPFTDVDFLYPEHSWTEDKKMMMNQVSGGQLKKEFKITFDFMSKDEQNAFFMPSVNGSGVNTTSNGLTIYFHANMTTNNFTIHTDMGRTHFIEISQEKSGQFYYFRIKRDNKVLFSGINNNPKTFDGSFRSRDMSRTANFNNIRVRSRMPFTQCQQVSTCPVRDCSVCEDECFTSYASYPPVKQCQCSHGKKIRADKRSCDWSGYQYFGGHGYAMFANGKNVSTDGNVTAMDYHFATNTYYYAVRNESHTVIFSYTPARKAPKLLHIEENPVNNLAVGTDGSISFTNGSHMNVISNRSFVSSKDRANTTDMFYDPCKMSTETYTSEVKAFNHVHYKIYTWKNRTLEETHTNLTCSRTIKQNMDKPDFMHVFGGEVLAYYTSKSTVHHISIVTGKATVQVSSRPIYASGVIYDSRKIASECYKHNSRPCNACSAKNGGCEDVCNRDYTKGGDAKCSCTFGSVAADGRSCSLDNHSIYGLHSGRVLVSSVERSLFIKSNNSGTVLGVEFDYKKDTIYYSQNNIITEYKWRQKQERILVNISQEYGPIEQLAFDWNKKVMYFTTRNYLHVSSGNTSRNVSYFGRTTGVVFEPCSHKVFVTCNASNTLYEWTKENGLKKVLSGLNDPQALAIDFHEKQLYFFETDRFTQTNYDGSCKNTIAEGLLGAQPYGLQVFGAMNFMFWTDLSMKSGYNMMNTTFDGKTKSIHKDNDPKYGLRSFWDRNTTAYACMMDLGKCVYGACKYNNGGCEDKCITNKDRSIKCQCMNGILKPNFKTCDYRNYHVSGVGYKVILGNKFNVTSTAEIRGIDFDYGNNQILFSTVEHLAKGQKSQIRMFDGKGVVKTIFTSDFEVRHVFYDSVKNDIYYITPYYLRKVNLYFPMSIALAYFPNAMGLAFDSCQRKVFVTCSTGVMVWEEGKGSRRLPFQFGHFADAMAIDEVNHKLYVFERRRGITQANYDGSCQTRISHDNSDAKPYGMVYIPEGDYIMWSDINQHNGMYSVMKTSVKDGYKTVMRRGRQATYAMRRIFDRKYEGSCPTKYTCQSKACAYNNDGCEQLCSIMSDGSRKCHCRFGGMLRLDGRTCDYSKVVYATSGRYLLFRHGDNLKETTIFHMAKDVISAITHNPNKTGIYYAVKHRNGGSSMFFKSINQKNTFMIANKPNYYIMSMAYDQQKDVLYYSMSNGAIQRMYNPMHANRRDEYILTAGEPTELTLSYCHRDLYYFDNIHKIGRVMRLRESERMPEVMNYGFGLFSGLAIDRERNTFYWKNTNDSYIRETTSGQCQRGIVKAEHVKFMAVYERKVYYADGKGNINMVNTANDKKHLMKKNPYPVTGGMKVFDSMHRMSNNSGGANNKTSNTPSMTSTTSRPSTTTNKMPKYEKDYIKGDDGHWYRFHQNSTTWVAAKAVCHSEGAHLIIIDSQATFDYVTKMMNREKYTNWIWIGGQDAYSNNTWRWDNGMHVDGKHWHKGEPNNYNNMKENCMAVHPMTGAFFYDALCSWQQPNFICQKGGYYKGPNDGYSYKIHKKSANWHEAKAVCESEGAHLTVVDSQKTFDYIAQLAKKSAKYMWVGAYDKFSNNTWKWINGQMVGKKFWLAGEPNNYNGVREDCMAMYPIGSGGLVDAYCYWNEPTFVCQKKEMKKTQSMDDGFRRGNDGNLYRYFSTPKTWKDAKQHCESQKAVLAVSKTNETRMYMRQMFPNNFWIGLSNHSVDNMWKWADGKDMVNTNWDPKMKKAAKGLGCAHMVEEGKWNQSSCEMKKPFLCQRAGVFQRCGATRQCHHQIFYGYGKEFGDAALPRGDEKSAHLKFNTGIPFFSKKRTDIFIHINGHITADKNDGNWTHSAKSNIPVLAVYMMDLTTEFGGDVFYRLTTDKVILDRIAFETSLTYTFSKGYRPSLALIVTWNNVSVKSDPSKKLTFQVIYHTDNYIAGYNTIYNKLKSAGGMTGYTEGKCNQLFNTELSRQASMNIAYSTNIGINGIYVTNLYKAVCSITKTPKAQFVMVKYKTSKASTETSQRFFYNGVNKITNFFTQTYSWIYESKSFVTSTVQKLDEIQVNYVYYINAPSTYNWGVSVLAFRDNLDKTMVRNGHVDLKKIHTGSTCFHVQFSTTMMRTPYMLLNVHANFTNTLDGLSSAWLHNVSMDGFNVCYKPMVGFWTPRLITVDYLATSNKSAIGATEMGAIEFSAYEQKVNEVLCKNLNFNYFYHEAPSVFITPEDSSEGASDVGDLLAWVKDSKKAHAVICVRKLKKTNSTVKVHFFVYQLMDKCSAHKCPAHLECHLDKMGMPSCGCKKNCTDYPQETFCASDLRTYKSRCEMEKHYCERKENHKIQQVRKLYDGMCKQYPYQTGKEQLEMVAELKSAFCKKITLDETRFYSGKDMKVLLTVFWNNQAIEMHDASASWTEDVTTKGFKACVMVAGRHFFKAYAKPSVQWVAYQDGVETTSPDVEVGTVNMKTWYTGSRCHFIKLKKHTPKTKVLVSVEHGASRVFTNAMTAWIEKTSNGQVFKVCARELQNFDGIHKNIKIHYMALHSPIDKYIVEPNEIHFDRQYFTKEQVIPPVCKTVMYNKNYPKLPNPTVILTAVNVSNTHINSVFSLHDIAVWIEASNDTHMTACFKSVRAGMYREEIKLQYAIFPTLCKKGWRYFDGHCYQFHNNMTDYNMTHAGATNACQGDNATLPEGKMNAAKAHFFGRTYEKNNSQLWMQQNKENMFLFGVSQNASQAQYMSGNCSDNTTSAYVCQKDTQLLTKACHCENGGKCMQTETGVVRCQCKKPFVGERCGKRVFMNCFEHTNMTHTMVNSMHVNVWYRYPGKQMVEYCPKRRGCASLDQAHPKVSDEVVQRNLIYGNHKYYNNGQCTKEYGIVHVQNCGNFYVYKVVGVKRRDLGSALCFEDYVRQL